MSPEEKLRGQRTARLAADRALLADLTNEQRKAFQAVRRELGRITKQIAEARARGDVVNPAWLFQKARLDRFERELGAELTMYLDLAKRKIEAGRTQALISGQEDALSLLRSTVPSGMPITPALPLAQLRSMVLNTAPGQPLGNLLAGLGLEAAKEAREKLIEGVALGLGTREIGRNLRDSFAGNSIRALLVARTEVIRTYRDAALATYRQNRGVIKGWLWIAQLGPRTCPVCIARHGSFHPLEETFASHPACRCSPAPATKDWADLGLPITQQPLQETQLRPESGEDWFARQDRSLQRRILGPGKLQLYEDGEIKLDDLVTETVHPVWGRGVRERPLRDLMGGIAPPTRLAPEPTPAAGVPHFATMDDALRWARENIADDIDFGTADLSGVSDALFGLSEVLSPYGIRVTRLAMGTPKGRALAKATWWQDLGESRIIARKVALDSKATAKRMMKNHADFLSHKNAEIARRMGQVSDISRPQPLRDIAQEALERITVTERWIVAEQSEKPVAALWAHEAAHILYVKADLEEAWLTALRAAGNTPLDSFALSEYGASSVVELFCEAMAAKVTGLPIPKTIERALRDTLAKVTVGSR